MLRVVVAQEEVAYCDVIQKAMTEEI